jgi:glycoprotein-N-acetylgalactosamine 3-beta-galactosyltransferase
MDIVYLNVTDTNRLNLTAKTIQTLLYANKYLIDEFDWILKADDDTYVIMENLKRFLLDKCPTEDTFYGFRYKPLKPDTFKHDFNSGGAGYVISNKAVKQFTSKYASDGKFCRNTTGAEDVDIAKCLGEIGVKPGDSRDEFGLERFHPLSYESMWNITPMNKTYHHARFPLKSVRLFVYIEYCLFEALEINSNLFLKREDCCSSSSISFHYTTGQKALQMDHLLYKLRPTIYY